jgi:hypothetical protein
MIYYYSLFTIFAIIGTMIVIDPNVGTYITLLTKVIKISIERFYWKIRFHPMILSSPIGRWWLQRKYDRMVKELMEESND